MRETIKSYFSVYGDLWRALVRTIDAMSYGTKVKSTIILVTILSITTSLDYSVFMAQASDSKKPLQHQFITTIRLQIPKLFCPKKKVIMLEQDAQQQLPLIENSRQEKQPSQQQKTDLLIEKADAQIKDPKSSKSASARHQESNASSPKKQVNFNIENVIEQWKNESKVEKLKKNASASEKKGAKDSSSQLKRQVPSSLKNDSEPFKRTKNFLNPLSEIKVNSDPESKRNIKSDPNQNRKSLEASAKSLPPKNPTPSNQQTVTPPQAPNVTPPSQAPVLNNVVAPPVTLLNNQPAVQQPSAENKPRSKNASNSARDATDPSLRDLDVRSAQFGANSSEENQDQTNTQPPRILPQQNQTMGIDASFSPNLFFNQPNQTLQQNQPQQILRPFNFANGDASFGGNNFPRPAQQPLIVGNQKNNSNPVLKLQQQDGENEESFKSSDSKFFNSVSQENSRHDNVKNAHQQQRSSPSVVSLQKKGEQELSQKENQEPHVNSINFQKKTMTICNRKTVRSLGNGESDCDAEEHQAKIQYINSIRENFLNGALESDQNHKSEQNFYSESNFPIQVDQDIQVCDFPIHQNINPLTADLIFHNNMLHTIINVNQDQTFYASRLLKDNEFKYCYCPTCNVQLPTAKSIYENKIFDNISAVGYYMALMFAVIESDRNSFKIIVESVPQKLAFAAEFKYLESSNASEIYEYLRSSSETAQVILRYIDFDAVKKFYSLEMNKQYFDKKEVQSIIQLAQLDIIDKNANIDLDKAVICHDVIRKQIVTNSISDEAEFSKAISEINSKRRLANPEHAPISIGSGFHIGEFSCVRQSIFVASEFKIENAPVSEEFYGFAGLMKKILAKYNESIEKNFTRNVSAFSNLLSEIYGHLKNPFHAFSISLKTGKYKMCRNDLKYQKSFIEMIFNENFCPQEFISMFGTHVTTKLVSSEQYILCWDDKRILLSQDCNNILSIANAVALDKYIHSSRVNIVNAFKQMYLDSNIQVDNDKLYEMLLKRTSILSKEIQNQVMRNRESPNLMTYYFGDTKISAGYLNHLAEFINIRQPANWENVKFIHPVQCLKIRLNNNGEIESFMIGLKQNSQKAFSMPQIEISNITAEDKIIKINSISWQNEITYAINSSFVISYLCVKYDKDELTGEYSKIDTYGVSGSNNITLKNVLYFNSIEEKSVFLKILDI